MGEINSLKVESFTIIKNTDQLQIVNIYYGHSHSQGNLSTRYSQQDIVQYRKKGPLHLALSVAKQSRDSKPIISWFLHG